MNKYFLPVYHSELKPWIKWWILKRLGGGESSLKAVTISSGTLRKVDKSKALSIKEYYGNAIQDGTPTPDSPIPVQTISGDNTFTINGEDYRLDFGGKNLLNNTATTQTINGVTFTVNEDKSVTMNGTATATTWLILNSSISLQAGTYTMSQGNTTNTVRVFCSALSGYCNNGVRTQTITETKTSDIAINIPNGTTISNLTLYPMIEKRKYSNRVFSICSKSNRTLQDR